MFTDHFLQSRSPGKRRRLRRLYDERSRRALIVPIDDSLIAGPIRGLDNLHSKLSDIIRAQPNGILAFPGSALSMPFAESPVSLILNLTTSTTLSNHTRKQLALNVEYAISIGADAVAVHVNLTSMYEPEMLVTLSTVIMEADRLGMPVMAIMYPRKEGDGHDENYEDLKKTNPEAYSALIAHACRVGMELGADIIKTQYTGSAESFQTAINASQGIPVLVAGGPLVSDQEALQRAEEVRKAGGSGVSYGRNVFSRANLAPFLSALKAVIHGNSAVGDATTSVNSGLQPERSPK